MFLEGQGDPTATQKQLKIVPGRQLGSRRDAENKPEKSATVQNHIFHWNLPGGNGVFETWTLEKAPFFHVLP